MGQNTNHIVPHEIIAQAIIQCIESEEYQKYPPPLGLKELRDLVVSDLGFTSKTTSAYITSGSVAGLYEIVKFLIREGDEVVTTDPGWFIFLQFVREFKAKVVTIPIYDSAIHYKLTPELFLHAITPKTRILYLVDPNNPLGSVYTKDEIRRFYEITRDRGIYFVHDCTYRDFADSHYPVLQFGEDHCIVTYSFSKTFGLAGLRIGAVVANEQLIDQLAGVQVNPFGVSTLSQRSAIAALRSKSNWIGDLKQKVRLHQQMVKEAVQQLPNSFIPVYPSQSNFLAIDIKGTGRSPEEICSKLQESKFFIRQAAYQSKMFADRFVKVSLTVPTSDVSRFCRLFPLIPEKIRSEGVKSGELF